MKNRVLKKCVDTTIEQMTETFEKELIQVDIHSPSSAGAVQRSFRVYFKTRYWPRKNLKPEQCRWVRQEIDLHTV